MSAWIVSHAHIDALLTFVEQEKISLPLSGTPTDAIAIKGGGATAIGRILLAENLRSVLHRYPNDTEETCPGTEGETVAGYTFKPFKDLPNMPSGQACVWVLKACHCLDYQCCETDDWKETQAFRILETIESAAIRRLPGYNEAPWGINRT